MDAVDETTQVLWSAYIDAMRRTSAQLITDNEALAAGALGLCGEAAEVVEEAEALGDKGAQDAVAGMSKHAGHVADVVKKIVFHGRQDLRTKLVDELGDVFWYIALLIDTADISLEEVLTYNVQKLQKRYPEGFSTAHSIQRADETK